MVISPDSNNEIEELFHTIGASFILIAIYAICIFIVEPVANTLILWYASNYVNDLDNGNTVKVVQMILRALLAIICSGYPGFLAGLKLFPKQNSRHTILLSAILVVLVPVTILGIELNHLIQQTNGMR